MTAIHFVLSGDPDTPTGGYLYDRRIIEGLRASGRDVRRHLLPGSFPDPDAAALAAADDLLAGMADGATVVVDGLCYGAMPEAARRHGGRLRIIALVHHPLAEETGLSAERRQALFAGEREALGHSRRVIVTSPFTVGALAAYGIGADKVGVVTPGTEPVPLAGGSGGPGLHLICAASLTYRKGHDVLIAALAHLKDRDWRLTIAGSGALDPATAADVRARIAAAGLAERVRLAGVLSGAELEAFYASGDVFVLASRYEGFGMALAEALARGLPIVSTTAGAIPHTVPGDAGLLVGADDVAALVKALGRVMDDASLRAALTAGARQARADLPDWPAQAAAFAVEIDRVAAP